MLANPENSLTLCAYQINNAFRVSLKDLQNIQLTNKVINTDHSKTQPERLCIQIKQQTICENLMSEILLKNAQMLLACDKVEKSMPRCVQPRLASPTSLLMLQDRTSNFTSKLLILCNLSCENFEATFKMLFAVTFSTQCYIK